MPFTFLLRYLPYLALVAAVIGGYLFWHHCVYEDGYADATAVYEERNAVTVKKAQELLDKRMQENSVLLEEHKTRYMGAIESYAEHIKVINATAIADSNKRLYVRTKPTNTNTCSNAMSIGTGDTTGADSGSGGIYQAELAEEVTRAIHNNATEVALGAASCQKLLDLVK